MHLTPTGVVKAALGGGYTSGAPAKSTDDDDHKYIRGDPEARGPCPGLNALANQGYLPRDGKNLTLPQVQHALQSALHMSPLLAASLTNSIKSLRRADGTFDLADTRRHNLIEHDASLTRLDFHQGDNYTIQPYLVQAIIDDANGGPVTLATLAKSFKRRDKESQAGGAPKLSIKMWFVKLLNIAGSINTAMTGGALTKEVAEALFLEERWADVILQNPAKRTVLTLLWNAAKLDWHLIFG